MTIPTYFVNDRVVVFSWGQRALVKGGAMPKCVSALCCFVLWP